MLRTVVAGDSPFKLRKPPSNLLSHLDKREGQPAERTLSKRTEIVKDLPRGGVVFIRLNNTGIVAPASLETRATPNLADLQDNHFCFIVPLGLKDC